MALYENLLVLANIALALVLLRTLRRPGGGGRGYAIVIGAQLLLATTALLQSDRYLGTVAISLCALTVLLPAALERGARQMFALGRPRLAVRLAGLRAMLMPGAGLGRQQQILAGFALLDKGGSDAALAYFRNLVAAAEDPAELAVIHEQIVAMLLYDHRWSDAVGHYEKHFHPGFAALRPTLALGMMRAYGELARLDDAARLLRAVEDGPLGSEPSASELLCQVRLHLLAHAGALGAVEAALTLDHGRRLGLSPGNAALLHGIACARAGQPERARALLQRAAASAGRNEPRLAGSARAALERLDEPPPDLSPAVHEAVQATAGRLESALRDNAGPRRLQPLRMTTALIVVSAAWYVATLAAGLAGVGLLEAGALTAELWRAGSWGRIFTAPFVHADLLSLLLDCYSLWLAGHVLERIHGWARTGLIALWSAAAGMAAAALASQAPAQMLAGGSAMATGVLVATLWTLSPMRTPGLASAVRRSVIVTLLILLGAHLFASLPGDFGLRAPPLALGTSALVASLLALLLPPALPAWTRRPLALLCLATLGLFGFAAARVPREDPIGHARAHRDLRPVEHGVRLALPTSFEQVHAVGERRHPLVPVFAGFLDTQALRAGYLVEVIVAEGPPKDGESALFRLDAKLAHELVVRPDGDAPPALREFGGYTLQRNGESIARVVERTVGERTVLLLAAPPSALDQAPELYAAILADAAPAP